MQDERNCNRACAEVRCSGYSGKRMYKRVKGEFMSRFISVKNGKKGGRPIYDSDIKINVPGFELVVLTPKQYGTLLERYGYALFYKALEILDDWLKSSPEGEKYRGRNNYAHFRSDGWLINSAKEI